MPRGSAAARRAASGQEAGQRDRLDRLDLVAQPGERPAAQRPQHLGVAPLGARARGRNSPSTTRPWAASRASVWWHDGDPEAEARGHLGGDERPVGAGVAADEVAERIVDRLGEGVGDAGRQGTPSPSRRRATSSTTAQRCWPGHQHRHDAAGVDAAATSQSSTCAGRGAARADLLDGQRAEQAQQVGDALAVPDPAVLGEPLQLGLDLGQHLGVEQLAQLGATEQLGQQALVEGEGGGAALGEGGVALVHERGDVAEQQRLRERRRPLGVHVDEPQPTLGDPAVSATSAGRS